MKEVSGQPYVVDNGYLFVFVLDYYRHNLINENVDFDMQTSFESAEGLLVGAIDVALVSENVAPKPRLPFEHVFHKTFTIAMLKNKEKLFRNMMRKSVSIIKNVRMENVKKHGHNKLLGS